MQRLTQQNFFTRLGWRMIALTAAVLAVLSVIVSPVAMVFMPVIGLVLLLQYGVVGGHADEDEILGLRGRVSILLVCVAMTGALAYMGAWVVHVMVNGLLAGGNHVLGFWAFLAPAFITLQGMLALIWKLSTLWPRHRMVRLMLWLHLPSALWFFLLSYMLHQAAGQFLPPAAPIQKIHGTHATDLSLGLGEFAAFYLVIAVLWGVGLAYYLVTFRPRRREEQGLSKI